MKNLKTILICAFTVFTMFAEAQESNRLFRNSNHEQCMELDRNETYRTYIVLENLSGHDSDIVYSWNNLDTISLAEFYVYNSESKRCKMIPELNEFARKHDLTDKSKAAKFFITPSQQQGMYIDYWIRVGKRIEAE